MKVKFTQTSKVFGVLMVCWTLSACGDLDFPQSGNNFLPIDKRKATGASDVLIEDELPDDLLFQMRPPSPLKYVRAFQKKSSTVF